MLRIVGNFTTPPKIEGSIEPLCLQNIGCARVRRLSEKKTHRAEQCAQFLPAEKFRPATQGQFVSLQVQTSHLGFGANKKSGDVPWEEDRAEYRSYQ